MIEMTVHVLLYYLSDCVDISTIVEEFTDDIQVPHLGGYPQRGCIILFTKHQLYR